MARREHQSRWNRYGKLASEKIDVTNKSGFTYNKWLEISGVGRGKGNLETYKAWITDIDPLHFAYMKGKLS